MSPIKSSPLLSGRPRSRIIRSGFSAASSRTAPAESSASTTLYPAATRLVRNSRLIGGSASPTRRQKALAMSQDPLAGRKDLRNHRHPDRQHRARAVAAVAGHDPAAQRFGKATAD